MLEAVNPVCEAHRSPVDIARPMVSYNSLAQQVAPCYGDLEFLKQLLIVQSIIVNSELRQQF